MMRAAASGSAWRVPVVVAVAAIVGVFSLADVALPWHAFADFGMRFDGNANIIDVEPGRGAGRAGIKPGDRIDIPATPITSRRYLITGLSGAINGTTANFVVERGSHERTVSLVAAAHPRTFVDNATDLLLMLSDFATLVICSVLLLLRPSKMTWAFFWYGCAVIGESVLASAYAPLWAFIAASVTIVTLNSITWLPLALFALRFPNDAATGWRSTAQRCLLYALPLVLPLAWYTSAGVLFGLPPLDWAQDAVAYLGIAGFFFTAVTFAITYAHASGVDRARLRWVILGLTIGQLGILAFAISVTVPGLAVPLPIWAINVLESTVIAVPITVAYAIVRHRVFDVRFVVGRAVVYALLTSALLVTVALLDYVVGQVLAQTHLATIVEVLASVAIGLSLNSLHARVEGVVDATLFRSRRRAELRLHRIGRGLIHSADEHAITEVLVSEPASAYALASAALFKRSAGGAFVREDAIGWDSARLEIIDASASMILQLHSSRGPVSALDAVWRADDLPHGAASPAVAFPIFVRERLEAVVFYGAHESGEDLDPEEREVLEELMRNASAAYDHAAAEIARAKYELLEAEVTTLRSLVAAES